MKILFISQDLVGGNIAYRLKNEGHKVKLFINDRGRKENFENLVAKSSNWRKEIAGLKKKDDLVIFDCNEFGKIQDQLRKPGFSVFGSSSKGDLLETDRQHAQKILSQGGVKILPTLNFSSLKKAVEFIRRNKKEWVIKQNCKGTGQKSLNYVGLLKNANDTIDTLSNYRKNIKEDNISISLQQKVEGIEIAVGRFFNGTNWIGPIQTNIEHKKLFPGNLGPTTSEMGTLAWYDQNEKNKLFSKTLSRLKPYLQKINYRGYIDINCIINEKGIFPLEITARLGSPIVHLQTEIHKSPWGEFLKAVADGKSYDLKWKKGYGIVVVVTVPTSNPFPFTKAEGYVSPKGLNIYFRDDFTQEDMKHVHFEDVSVKKVGGKKQYYISDDRGYVLYVTGMGKTIEEARRKTYKIIGKIIIPKMFYRNDIGSKFIEEDQAKLKKWGYL